MVDVWAASVRFQAITFVTESDWTGLDGSPLRSAWVNCAVGRIKRWVKR